MQKKPVFPKTFPTNLALKACQAGLPFPSKISYPSYSCLEKGENMMKANHSNPCDPRVAYLSAVHGIVEWRFGIKTLGYANCSVVTEPEQIIWLDSLFWQYLATEEQKKTTGRPSAIRRAVEDRIRTGMKLVANRTREYNELVG